MEEETAPQESNVDSLVDNAKELSAPMRRFKLKEIETATDRFSSVRALGRDRGSRVFRGELRDKNGRTTPVAVKRVEALQVEGFDDWLSQVLLLDKLRHPHLVRLLGYCTEQGERILVFLYCSHGSLDQALFDWGAARGRPLSWGERTRIAVQTAAALVYLHGSGMMHGALKPSNILLEEDGSARLTDIRMPRELTGVSMHSSGKVPHYSDPASVAQGILTPACDVYSFGVIVIELLTGQPLRNADGQRIVDARSSISPRALAALVDSSLAGEYDAESAAKMFELACRCMDEDIETRPTSGEVFETLTQLTPGE